MVDWHSPEVLQDNALAFTKSIHCLIGLYLWEFVNTLDFDWAVISGEQKFRWPLFFYFYARYGMLGVLIGLWNRQYAYLSVVLFALNVTRTLGYLPIKSRYIVRVLFLFIQIVGEHLSWSRQYQPFHSHVWGQSLYVTVPLVALICGQFGIILKSVTNVHCSTLFAAMYLYTMGTDFICDLWYKRRHQHKSRIMKLMFVDVTSLLYIFSLLDLNDVMSVIADGPASILATVASCRVVRRLYRFRGPGAEIYSASGGDTSSGLNNRTHPLSQQARIDVPAKTAVAGVHVQMQTFTETSYGTPGSAKDREIAGELFDRDSSESELKRKSAGY
ncbi:uncharacterized protein EV420DRAFT_1568231 [Desarmillaria tabescens]|uniref:Uncharacterized protein n=1 Tax=Armillaria tabescens TaxID=1929756 RepID=A0AA39MVT8_ARMTA|nr:uncharacterized protein EV420DRAFT_1568231 [Desarmillaria tabescens]KAK0447919.1 hypothetical protein EV420DRAFT_1568231 [Desarmillaria tabescens]